MGNICRLSNSGSEGPETGIFIQYVNGREPQIHKFWCCDICRIFREVHSIARMDIPDGTNGEFVTDYLSENGRHDQIIGELFTNGNVQFIGLSKIWGSGVLYIFNIRAHVETKGWCISVVTSYNGNPGYGTDIGSWGGKYAHSTVSWNGNWDLSVNASSDNSPQSPISPRVARRRVHK